LKRRPSPQQLVDAKILKEAPVAATNNQPNFEDIQRCVEWLRKYAMHMEGVFRVSGSAQDNTTFADKLVNHKLDIEQFTADQLSPHAVTTGLKIYMREKTSPVIPYKYYKEYMDNYRKSYKSAESVKNNCQRLISTLPENNRRILVMLCKFLKELAQYESENKMNPHNLGVVFGPTLMRTESTGLESLTECDSQIAVVEEIIIHINEVDVTAVASPESVPSACGSSGAASNKPAGGPAAGGAKPGMQKSASMMVPPPMLTVPKGRPGLKSSGSVILEKKPTTPTTPTTTISPTLSPKPEAGPSSPSTAAPPSLPASVPATLPTSPKATSAPILARATGSPPSNPPVQTMPPGARPPVGVAPIPGKPPVGHAPPVPGSSNAPAVTPLTGSKLKLVPKFKVNVRTNTTTALAQTEETPEGLQQEILAALMAPNDTQKTKAAATQLSSLFETNPQEATDVVTSDPATAASLILLLGRAIAVSSS